MELAASMLAGLPASHGRLARDGLRSCTDSLHLLWHVTLRLFAKTSALPLWLNVFLGATETGAAFHTGLLRGLKQALRNPETDQRDLHTYHLTGLLHLLWPLGNPHPVQMSMSVYHTGWYWNHSRPELTAGQTFLERFYLMHVEQRYQRDVICIKLGGGDYHCRGPTALNWNTVWSSLVQDLPGLTAHLWEYSPPTGPGPYTAKLTFTANLEHCPRLEITVDGALLPLDASAAKRPAQYGVIAHMLAGVSTDALAARQVVTALRVAERYPDFHQSFIPIPYPAYHYAETVISLVLRRQAGQDVLVRCDDEAPGTGASTVIASAIPLFHALTVDAFAQKLYDLTFSFRVDGPRQYMTFAAVDSESDPQSSQTTLVQLSLSLRGRRTGNPVRGANGGYLGLRVEELPDGEYTLDTMLVIVVDVSAEGAPEQVALLLCLYLHLWKTEAIFTWGPEPIVDRTLSVSSDELLHFAHPAIPGDTRRPGRMELIVEAVLRHKSHPCPSYNLQLFYGVTSLKRRAHTTATLKDASKLDLTSLGGPFYAAHFGCTAVAHTLAAVQEMPFLLPEQLISCCSCEAGITCRCDDAKQFAMEYAAADALMTLFLGITTRILCDP